MVQYDLRRNPFVTDATAGSAPIDAAGAAETELQPSELSPLTRVQQYERTLSNDVVTDGTVANFVSNVDRTMARVQGLFASGHASKGIQLAQSVVDTSSRYNQNISYLASLNTYVPGLGRVGQQLSDAALNVSKCAFLDTKVNYLGTQLPVGEILRDKGLVDDARENELVTVHGFDPKIAHDYIKSDDEALRLTYDAVMQPALNDDPREQSATDMANRNLTGRYVRPERIARAKAYAAKISDLWGDESQPLSGSAPRPGLKTLFGKSSRDFVGFISSLNQTTMTGPDAMGALVSLAGQSSSLSGKTDYTKARLVGSWYQSLLEETGRAKSVEKGAAPGTVVDTRETSDGKRILNMILVGAAGHIGPDGKPLDVDFESSDFQHAALATFDMYKDLKARGLDLFALSTRLGRDDLVKMFSTYTINALGEAKLASDASTEDRLIRPAVKNQLTDLAKYCDGLDSRFVGDSVTYQPYYRPLSGNMSDRTSSLKFTARGGSASLPLDVLADGVKIAYAKTFGEGSLIVGDKAPGDLETTAFGDRSMAKFCNSLRDRITSEVYGSFQGLKSGREVANVFARALINLSNQAGGARVGMDEVCKFLVTEGAKPVVGADGAPIMKNGAPRLQCFTTQEAYKEFCGWVFANVNAKSLFSTYHSQLTDHYVGMYHMSEKKAAEAASTACANAYQMVKANGGVYDSANQARIKEFFDNLRSYGDVYVNGAWTDDKGNVIEHSTGPQYFNLQKLTERDPQTGELLYARDFPVPAGYPGAPGGATRFKPSDWHPEDVPGTRATQAANHMQYIKLADEARAQGNRMKLKGNGSANFFLP